MLGLFWSLANYIQTFDFLNKIIILITILLLRSIIIIIICRETKRASGQNWFDFVNIALMRAMSAT